MRQQEERKLFSDTSNRLFLIECKNRAELQKIIKTDKDSASIVHSYGDIYLIKGRSSWIIRNMLALSSAGYIDVRNRKAKEEMILNDVDFSANYLTTVHNDYPWLDGHTTTVSVKEDGPDEADIDFKGRLLSSPNASGRVSTHSTIMHTIIGGGGNSYYTAKGAAWGASMSSSSFDVLLPDSDAIYRNNNITVQNHSYGTGIENYYGADAAAYDASVVNNPALLHIFSSGNSGDQADSQGRYKGLSGWANLTGSFKMAKNILTVGSIDSFYHIPRLSSKGPAYDGRIKPEIVAFGEDGSSGAAALVSGTALLLQEMYKSAHGGQLPDASLVKAILLNSAGETGKADISYPAGFGSLNAWRAVKEMEAGHFFTGSIDQDQTLQFPLTIPSGTSRLKIMLCWTDDPAQPNAILALINDLDLTLSRPSSSEHWLPWVLNSAPFSDSIALPPIRARDTLNPQEQITLHAPSPGDYLLEVHGSRIPTGSHRFYIAYQWDTTDNFHWMFPTAADNLLPARPAILRWQSDTLQPPVLEYRLIGDLITSNAPWHPLPVLPTAAYNYLTWTPPDTTALAQLRMFAHGQWFLSDTFTISPRPVTGVGFICPDSLLLYWNKTSLSRYKVYNLTGRYLVPLQTLNDTATVLPSPSGSTGWYAVAPLFLQATGVGSMLNSRPALRSYAFNPANQGTGCYINTFTADLNGVSASLHLQLGTSYRVDSIHIEKQTIGAPITYHALGTFTPSPSLAYALSDDHLHAGANIYRASIILSGGRTIYSAPQYVFYTGNSPYYVYPNPVYRPQSVHVLASDLHNPVFRLFDASGRLVLSQLLPNLQQEIPTAGLAKGFYFYTIDAQGEPRAIGKLIIQ